jgi:hypothetical protein
MRVRPAATNVAFPELPLASTQTFRTIPPGPFLVAGNQPERQAPSKAMKTRWTAQRGAGFQPNAI